MESRGLVDHAVRHSDTSCRQWSRRHLPARPAPRGAVVPVPGPARPGAVNALTGHIDLQNLPRCQASQRPRRLATAAARAADDVAGR